MESRERGRRDVWENSGGKTTTNNNNNCDYETKQLCVCVLLDVSDCCRRRVVSSVMTGLPEFPTLGCCMCSAAHMSPHNVRIKGKPWEPLVNHRRPAPAAQKHVHLFAAKACQCHDIHAACAHVRHGSKLWTCIAQVALCTNSGHASCDRCCHQLSLAGTPF